MTGTVDIASVQKLHQLVTIRTKLHTFDISFIVSAETKRHVMSRTINDGWKCVVLRTIPGQGTVVVELQPTSRNSDLRHTGDQTVNVLATEILHVLLGAWGGDQWCLSKIW